MQNLSTRLAQEISASHTQIDAAIRLLDEGATVPFIARYRKEATGGLDDGQLRTLHERLNYLRELDERRGSILKSIEEHGQLTPKLKQQIEQAESKVRLEDLYLPFKKKRRSKGSVALEAGLGQLADQLLSDAKINPERAAKVFINPDPQFKGAFEDVKGVLEGARFIVMERIAEDADLAGQLREHLQDRGQVSAQVVSGKEQEGQKFRDYFEHHEALKNMPSHRLLAVLRGRNEGILKLNIDVEQQENRPHPCESMIARQQNIPLHKQQARTDWLKTLVQYSWKTKLQPRLETDLLGELRQRAEQEAIEVFARNLKDLLLAAPAGQRVVLGLDPGLRTGVKIAVVDNTGQLLDHTAIYPHAPRNQWDQSIAQLTQLAKKHEVQWLAIGNGTASRETEKLCAELIKKHPELSLQKVMVSEAGASVYSASEIAAKEFPELDVTIRGAISIARRLQDPLAELVKIDPKSIGVGQYQHDVNQGQLATKLAAVVEDCVNTVGVEVNTASAELLQHVAGLNQTIAHNIVQQRNDKGRFTNRRQLLKVARLGAKSFEQAAGFLRIRDGENPLDASAVHPESYSVVKRIVDKTKQPVAQLIGNQAVLKSLNPKDYVDEQFGLPTVHDILEELEKPGRDPRPQFKSASFREGVETIEDVKPAMVLEGVVTNVTHFGAFVDIGVHQDGLVHISALAGRFVSDPHEVVKAGDVVTVKVLEVDATRKRIGLSMRLQDEAERAAPKPKSQPKTKQRPQQAKRNAQSKPKQDNNTNSAFAEALAKAKSRGRKH